MPAKLTLVLGKGGVGRTTLSLALALGHAELGERTALCSLLARQDLSHEPRALVHTGWGEPPAELEWVEIDPRGAVDHVVRRLVPLPALAGLVTAHPAYDALFGIAPGVKELAVLHRLLALVDEGGARKRVVVDGLATGHGTHFLEAPRKSAEMLVGNLAERARAIDAALTDPARTTVLLATTLEETPVRETVELAGRLRHMGFPLQAILANRALPEVLPDAQALPDLRRIAAREQARLVGSELGLSWRGVQGLAQAALHLELQAREEREHLPALHGLGLPVIEVPLELEPRGMLRRIAAKLLEAGL
ncbi:MAG: ArsA family ATPase [Halobacteriales archaeon]|nr:ArsA family ATPase [Halobacteriales archaeon]